MTILALFAIFVVSRPFLREPVAPVVHVTVEPEATDEATTPPSEPPTGSLPEATEPPSEPPTPAYETGQRAGEQVDRLWQETKEFSKGFWDQLTNKED
ncbi:hypothetical protein [Microbacterium sp. CIAB417]|uniref:hypothetical protein n=1 Tax=Microbacterium sp. CIAB417 TaxID=2860287 RepID=UPI001FACC5A5|nr:hypothetical protein [Microbacterium sp. CIAB417]